MLGSLIILFLSIQNVSSQANENTSHDRDTYQQEIYYPTAIPISSLTIGQQPSAAAGPSSGNAASAGTSKTSTLKKIKTFLKKKGTFSEVDISAGDKVNEPNLAEKFCYALGNPANVPYDNLPLKMRKEMEKNNADKATKLGKEIKHSIVLMPKKFSFNGFPNVTIKSEIGYGVSSRIYTVAEYPHKALKLIVTKTNLTEDEAYYTIDSNTVDRDVNAQIALRGQSNIVQISAYSKTVIDGAYNVYAILTELGKRDLLDDLNAYWNEHKRPFPEPLAREICRQILTGIENIHKMGMIHRDLKPENILVFEESNGKKEYKIGDFGGVIRNTDRNVQQIGSFGYNAPEILMEKPMYVQSNYLFSFGIILYNLLCYKRPYTQEELQTFANDMKKFTTIDRARLLANSRGGLSDKVIELLTFMLGPHEKRKTLAEIKAHAWFTQH